MSECIADIINDGLLRRCQEERSEAMWELLAPLIPKVCQGCIYELPSQVDHDVCLMNDDEEDRFSIVLHRAWSILGLEAKIKESVDAVFKVQSTSSL